MSTIPAIQPSGLQASASDLPVTLIHPPLVSGPCSVFAEESCAAIVAREITCVLALPSAFKRADDRDKFEHLRAELHEHAAKIDAALALLASPDILPICKGTVLQRLDSVPGAVHSHQVCEFSLVSRSKGDDLGVIWRRVDFSFRPTKVYDEAAAHAGEAIAEAYDSIQAYVHQRTAEHRKSLLSRVIVFPAGPLVGPHALDPGALLDKCPASLHVSVKRLMQGDSMPPLAESARKVEESIERHTPAVYNALRYATLQGYAEPLLAMARGFPENRSETLAFALAIAATPSISEQLRRASSRAAAYAEPRYAMPEEAESKIAQELTQHEKGEVMRFWLANPDHCDSLSAQQREEFVAAVAASIEQNDLALVRAVTGRYPELTAHAASQNLLLRASLPHGLSHALSRLGEFVREHAPFRVH